MSRRLMREFLEQEEATRAARSKDIKRAERQRRKDRFARFLVEKIEHIEAAGNPAGAEQQRNFWRRFPEYRHLFPAPAQTEGG